MLCWQTSPPKAARTLNALRSERLSFRKLAKNFGVTVKEIFWTHGQYDIVVIAEAPDEFSATALELSLLDLGNVRTQTLRAFSAAEMDTIIAKA